jgi:hypothetical protein
MVTYRPSVLLRAVALVTPVLLTVSFVFFLREPFSLPRFLVNVAVLALAWTGAVFACRVRTRVGDGVVEVRRVRTARLDLRAVRRARRGPHGTVAELQGGETVDFPLYLPGVVSSTWVIIDPNIVESSLTAPGGRRASIAQLREVVRGKYLPRGFTEFPPDA